MDEEFITYLRGQRESIRSRIALFRSGRCFTTEIKDGKSIDTTTETLIRLEDDLEEIDRLLTKAGVPLDA